MPHLLLVHLDEKSGSAVSMDVPDESRAWHFPLTEAPPALLGHPEHRFRIGYEPYFMTSLIEAGETWIMGGQSPYRGSPPRAFLKIDASRAARILLRSGLDRPPSLAGLGEEAIGEPDCPVLEKPQQPPAPTSFFPPDLTVIPARLAAFLGAANNLVKAMRSVMAIEGWDADEGHLPGCPGHLVMLSLHGAVSQTGQAWHSLCFVNGWLKVPELRHLVTGLIWFRDAFEPVAGRAGWHHRDFGQGDEFRRFFIPTQGFVDADDGMPVRISIGPAELRSIEAALKMIEPLAEPTKGGNETPNGTSAPVDARSAWQERVSTLTKLPSAPRPEAGSLGPGMVVSGIKGRASWRVPRGRPAPAQARESPAILSLSKPLWSPPRAAFGQL